MSRPAKKGPPAVGAYPRRVPIYENEAGVSLLREIARRRGCSMAAAVRQIVREEAVREGLTEVTGGEKVKLDPAQIEGEARKPFWERASEFANSIPVEEQERFPVDGSEQLDHYVYGVP